MPIHWLLAIAILLTALQIDAAVLTVGPNSEHSRLQSAFDIANEQLDSPVFGPAQLITPNFPNNAFGGELDNAGKSISLDGERLLVGVPGSSDSGFRRNGEALVYELNSETLEWELAHRLVPNDSSSSDRFGWKVSLDDNSAAISAILSNNNGDLSGAVYIFEFDGVSWIQTEKLFDPNGFVELEFGSSVSLDNDRLIVGVRNDNDKGGGSGAAFFYEFNGINWIQTQKVTSSDASAFSNFGFSASLDGNLAIVGAIGTNGQQTGAAYIYEFDGNQWNETTILVSSDGDIDDRFGVSVDLDGNRALIGAWADDDNGVNSGSAYIFELISEQWVETIKIKPSDGSQGAGFGDSVSLSSYTAIIGATADSQLASKAGSAYIFEFDGFDWIEVQKLLPPESSEEDYFGGAVDLSSEHAIVGAPSWDNVVSDSGAVFIYDFDQSNWSLDNSIILPNSGTFDEFGDSVSIYKNRALVGAWRDDEAGNNSGSAFIFEFNGSQWQQTGQLIPSDGTDDLFFGHSVSIHNNTAVVGAYGNNDNGFESGAVYVFSYNGENWHQVDKLVPEDGDLGDRFGYSVSVYGNQIGVGAYQDNANGVVSGSAYLFEYNGADWIESHKLMPSDESGAVNFGSSISLNQNRVLVGANSTRINDISSGSSFIFDYIDGKWIEIAHLIPSDQESSGGFGFSVSLDGDRALIGAISALNNGINSGAAYVFEKDEDTWSQTGRIAPDESSSIDEFGHSVSLFGDLALISNYLDDDLGEGSGSAYLYQFDGTEWIEMDKFLPDGLMDEDEFGHSVSLYEQTVLIGAPLDDINGTESGTIYIFSNRIFSNDFE